MARPGWADAIDDAHTPVEAVVDNAEHTVVLDLSKTSILTRLAAAFQHDSTAWAEFSILVHGGLAYGARATQALDDLRRMWQVTDALTLTWAPVKAEQLGQALHEAALEPERCVGKDEDGTWDCSYYATPGDDLCNEHLSQQAS